MKVYENTKELGKRIKKAREDANLTQSKLHDLTGISITQISAYENGIRNIGLQTLYKISVATNKTMDEIYGGPTEIKPILKATNDGELIVNCIVSLVEKNVITSLVKSKPNIYVPTGNEYYYQIGFVKFIDELDELVKKLVDFEKNKENYPDPDGFKKQILAATVNKINLHK